MAVWTQLPGASLLFSNCRQNNDFSNFSQNSPNQYANRSDLIFLILNIYNTASFCPAVCAQDRMNRGPKCRICFSS